MGLHGLKLDLHRCKTMMPTRQHNHAIKLNGCGKIPQSIERAIVYLLGLVSQGALSDLVYKGGRQHGGHNMDLTSLLMGQIGNENDYLAQDPFYTTGINIAKTPLPAPQDNAQAFFMPVLQGLLSGSLAGYGKSQAKDAQYQAYSASPLMQALSGTQNVGPVADGAAYGQEMLHSYGHTNDAGDIVAPTGWTPKIGQGDLVLGAQALQSKLESAAELQKTKNDILKSVLTEGVKNGDLTPSQALGAVGPNGIDTSTITTADNAPVVVPKRIKQLEDDTYKRIIEHPAYKQLADIEPNFKAALDLVKQDTKAADIGLISTIARIRDPNSTVREGEIKINQDVQSYLDQTLGNWRAVVMGDSRLKPEVRLQIIESVAPKYNETGLAYKAARDALLNTMQQQGGDPSRIPTMDFTPFGGMKLQKNIKTGETRLVPK